MHLHIPLPPSLAIAFLLLVGQSHAQMLLPAPQPGYKWVAVPKASTTERVPGREGDAQSWAQTEANRLAAGGIQYYQRTGGHPGGNNPHARFTGTGYGTSNPSTCTPPRPMTLVADAVARGIDGYIYRVRSWR